MKPEEAPSCREQGTPLPGAGSPPAALPVLCAGCGRGIWDRFLLRVNERSWHERCLRCSECGRALRGRCFSRERRLLCPPDYERLSRSPNSPFPRISPQSLRSPGSPPAALPVLCAGCGRGIWDRFLLRVNERSWHERCLRCSECGRALRGRCFSRERRLLCPPDYERLFPRRCGRCLGALGRSERVLRVPGRVFHERCLRCGSCGRRLRSGDEFVLRDGRILCRGHAEPEPGPGATSPAAEDGARSEDEEGRDSRCSRNAGGKDPKRSKRPRTILSSQQRRAFKASFEVSSKPCRKVRETLAAETGLTVRVVQVWFQNQRAKMKKIARRQQQQEQLGNSRGAIPGGRGPGRAAGMGMRMRRVRNDGNGVGKREWGGKMGMEWENRNGSGKMGMGWIRDGGIRNWEVTTSPSHIPISHILISHILIFHIPPFPTFPGLHQILVPFSRIPPPPLEPNGFRSEAGTFRGTPPELRPYDSEGVFQELDGDTLGSLGAALISTENSQQLILGNAGIPEIPEPRDALERLYPGNARIPKMPEPGNPMERLYSMQSSYFTS
ncbi:LOW QUALITY PROTEIN: LIM homeobox transcription factor 1-alpha-like [Melospiza melodia melodia]|uniref:LOW QUALITY PROTEIN: LIM homeobox transcription factor 1-alpha-like n=1 Tax=Melospiza melodia melodia TaxID=1914991 RepID=UPI002FD3A713